MLAYTPNDAFLLIYRDIHVMCIFYGGAIGVGKYMWYQIKNHNDERQIIFRRSPLIRGKLDLIN